MQEHYGADVVEELHALRMGLAKVTDEELRELLDQYRNI
jgi:N-formylglutamate amidohydrolase